ncbi:MAG: hypothetical protein GW795_09675 [Cyanobacteria bacterium]|nr:hypothetical protein [Cyanobacteria bacterium CG_2015-16_32_12]NCO77196.1 hypothetical protein [Cyanobacteria bacterium CG_2015-22_32_23]NCQ05631.1 hypothetical protein [Cyanobacteria bacterium CG_2015-09_32_10]NCQ42141.1 hypothetical protein [Cyanobacteria bacterium CG_2015-04_32_10]NCS84795.1 hypothetical protein [Cyanobacteria bacterium CG_2015-02_32_10]
MNNITKPLFSDHYLTHHTQSTSDGQEDINNHLKYLQELYQQKRDILPNLNESQTEVL